VFCLQLTNEEEEITELSYRKGEEEGYLTPDADGRFWFTLMHGETIVFGNLLSGTEYEVTEAGESSAGYIVTSQNALGVLSEEDVEVHFINTRNVTVSTTADMDRGSFLVFLIAGFFGLFLLLYKTDFFFGS
jgi:hypothetical protein